MNSINLTFDNFDKSVTRFDYKLNDCVKDVDGLSKEIKDIVRYAIYTFCDIDEDAGHDLL